MNKVKKILKNIIAIVVIILAVTVSVRWVVGLEITTGGAYENIRSFYAQEKNSLDVVFVGSSRIYCNVNPTVLWEEYGIKSFDFATSGQNISTAPLFVKEVFKYQNPSAVVIEVSQFDDGNPIYGNDMLWATTGLRPSLDKYKYIWQRSYESDRVHFVLNFPVYHHLYSDIEKDDQLYYSDFGFPETGSMGNKGYMANYSKIPQEEPKELRVDNTDVTDETIAAIEECRDICEKNGSKLIMFYAPSREKDSFTRLTEYAENNNVIYINANECSDKLKVDYQEDFIDNLHLSYYGANRVSSFLGDCLMERVFSDTPLKSESEKVKKSYIEFGNYIENARAGYFLVRTGGLGDYFNLYFPNPNYVMIVSLSGEYDKVHYGQESVLRDRCGIDYESYLNGGTWVFENNTLSYYSAQDEIINYVTEAGGKTITVTGEKNAPVVCVDGKDYTVLKNGNRISNSLQIVTFDKLQNKIIDAVAFDADNDYAWNRNPEFMK